MNKRNIQIVLTNNEYTQLENAADKCGLPLFLYIRGRVLEKDELSESYTKLIKKINDLPVGTKFTIKALFGVEWTMGRGTKLNLGKIFNKQVMDGKISNVEFDRKDSSNTTWYEKIDKNTY